MFKKSKILKKLGAGFMAGLCAFSMLGSSVSGAITANAASTSTENSAFPSSDTVIAKAATLLGTPYTFGNKGYWYAYNQGQYTPLSVQTINNLGIDCSGLVYYTLTQLGYKTSGFSWNNPVPVDTDHWLSVNDNCTISYSGKTSKIDVEKKNIKTTDRPYWECSDGSTITPGSVVVAQNPYGEDHAWIYMGEFNSRNEVVSYLKSIGVSESLINSKTVGDGKGAGGRHWRIEANGSEGVVINNKTDGKTATVMNMSAFRITSKDVKFTITKVYKADNTVKINGISPIDGSQAIYGVYTDKACKNKAGEIKIDKNGSGSIELPNKQYYVKEIKAPTGYSLSTEVFALNANENVNVTEDYLKGNIIINKTAEDGIIGQREFRVTGPRYCAGTHIHISADDYTPQQIRNLVNIFASKEDFLWDALQVSSARESYCHKMDKQFIEEINRKKPKDMEEIKGLWYHGRMSEQFQHYSNSRYVICNLHSFFQHGHYEIRAYNGSLHAGEVRSQIVLALAISNAAMTKKYCSPHVSQSDNMRYSFRVWLLNLGLIGDEFKNCRTHLLKHLDGDIAWRHPEDGIAARAKLKEKREAERQAARGQRVEPVSEVQELNENVSDENSEPTESECENFEEDEEMGMEMSM